MKSRDFYSLSKTDRVIAISGVPVSYLKKLVDPSSFNFTQTSYRNESQGTLTMVQPNDQGLFYSSLIKNIDTLGDTGVYAIGSSPTDQASYQIATLISKTYFEAILNQGQIPKLKWIDLGHPDWDYLKNDEDQSLVCIHGLSATSEIRKIELAKDFIRRSENATTLVLATTPNILEYCIKKLEVSPDGVLQLSKTTSRVVT